MPRSAPGPGERREVERGLSLAGLFLVSLLALAGTASALSLEDVASQAGLEFARVGHPELRPTFLEFMGGGACWLDYDNDGFLDLYMVNGWLNDTAKAREIDPRSALFRNEGDGTFRDVSRGSGVDLQGWTQGCAAADYNADGREDLLIVGYGIQWLLRNRGDGTFANASAQAGISPEGKCREEPCWGTGAAWADYDRDGCLDVYVVNFVEYNLTEGGPIDPGDRHGQANQLYRNNCDRTFDDVTAQAGVDGAPSLQHSKNWATTWLDYDLDGWLDIYVASDGVPNILYRNEGNGTFTDVAEQAGVDDPRNSMGLTVGDCDEDGDEDLFFTHYAGIQGDWNGWDGFWVNNGNGTFSDHSGEPDLDLVWQFVRWGTLFADLDNDGDLDLHAVSGHTEPGPADPDQPQLLWLGSRDCTWKDARAPSGPAMELERNSRGSSYADYDWDGDLDMVVVNLANEPALLQRSTGAAGNWLQVELRQPGGNPRALMAQVNATLPDGTVLHRRVNPYQSIHGSNPASVHFGLGSAESVNLTVRWPDLEEQTFTGVGSNQLVRVLRSEARLQNDTLAPRSALRVEGIAGEPGWWRSGVSVAVQAEDRGVTWRAGVRDVWASLDSGPEVQNPAPFALGEGLHRFTLRSDDLEGNREPLQRVTLGVDATPPVSAASFQGVLVAGWYRGPVRVALACNDALSGVGRLEWRLDTGAWVGYHGPFDLTRPGSHAFGWRCVDAAGNAEAEHVKALAIDLGHPETLALLGGLEGSAGWWRSAVEVTLDAAGGLQNVTATNVSVDGGPWQPYAGPLLLASDGAHELRFWSEDDAGRREPERALAVNIDATPPSVSVHNRGKDVDADWALIVGPRHGIAASAEDATAGVASLRVRRDGGVFRDYTEPLTFRYEGLHEVAVRASDAAGNEAAVERAVYLDLTAPSMEVLRPGDQTLNVGNLSFALLVNPTTARAVLVGAVPIEAGVGPDVAGVDALRFLVDGAQVAVLREPPWVWVWSLQPGWPYREVELQVEDRVGNARVVGFAVWATGDLAMELPTRAVPTPLGRGISSFTEPPAAASARLPTDPKTSIPPPSPCAP